MGRGTDPIELVRTEGELRFAFLVDNEGFAGPEPTAQGLSYQRADLGIEIDFCHYNGRDLDLATRLFVRCEAGSRPRRVALDTAYVACGLGSAQDVPGSAQTLRALSKHLASQAVALQRLMALLTPDRSREILCGFRRTPTDLQLAHQAADRADALAMRHFTAGDLAWQRAKADGSPVTAADHEVEHAVRTLINEASPTDAFLGEEFGAHGRSRRRWIVDPIDGTASFLAGEPEWGTLIALTDGGIVLLGMVSAPACGRRWWAAPGGGAWTAALPTDSPDSAPSQLAVTTATSLQDAAIGIWPPPARLSADDRRLAAALAAQARTTVPAVDWDGPTASTPSATIRKPSTGSGTCHGALLVATGQLDAFLLVGGGPWDVAAVVPIVREAGGAYSELSEGGDTITALFSAPGIHQQILDIAGSC